MSILFGRSALILQNTQSFNYATLLGINGQLITLPILSIIGQLSADYDITKTLAGSFSYTTFLDKPSILKVTGIVQSTSNKVCTTNSTTVPTFDDLLDFYTDNNISVASNLNGSNTLQLIISNSSYKCSLLNMKYSTLSEHPYMTAFLLTLIGKRN